MTIRKTTREIDLGFGIHDSERLENQRPRVQILTPKTPDPEDQRVFCAKCKCRMEWLGELMELHMCKQCGQFSDYKLNDAHILTDKKRDKLFSYTKGPYTETDPLEKPFFQNVEIQTNTPDYENIHSKQRVQNIRMKGSFKDAWNYSED